MNRAATRIAEGVLFAAGLAALAALFLPASVYMRIIPNDSSEPFSSGVLLTLFLLLSAALMLGAVLFLHGLVLLEQNRESQAGDRVMAILLLLFGVVMLAKALHSVYQFTLWDNTHDALGYFCLAGPFLALFIAGALAIAALPGRLKATALLFMVVVPALVTAVSAYGQRVDIRQLTEDRAARVGGAIGTYYEENGRYPQNLKQLTPRYMLSVPPPAIIFGQDWCYASSGEDYALGYVTRDHWSDPRLYGRVYPSSRDEAPDRRSVCEEEIGALIARAPQYYELQAK